MEIVSVFSEGFSKLGSIFASFSSISCLYNQRSNWKIGNQIGSFEKPNSNGEESSGKSKGNLFRDPNLPKKPNGAFLIFYKEHVEVIKKNHKELTGTEMMRLAGQDWKAMTDAQRKVYSDKARAEQAAYRQKMAIYNQNQRLSSDLGGTKADFEPKQGIHRSGTSCFQEETAGMTSTARRTAQKNNEKQPHFESFSSCSDSSDSSNCSGGGYPTNTEDEEDIQNSFVPQNKRTSEKLPENNLKKRFFDSLEGSCSDSNGFSGSDDDS